MGKNKPILMDAGTILFLSSGGYGPNIGQLKTELSSLGKVRDIRGEDNLPAPMKGFDFLLDVSGLLVTNLLAVRLMDAGPAGSFDSEGREVRRYAVELLATPTRKIKKTISTLKEKYKSNE